MSRVRRLNEIARTDRTFTLRGELWVGRCLICNGPIAFDSRTGEGATVEHLRARGRGGTEEPENLAIVHGRCNAEKGLRWDARRRRGHAEYEGLVARLLDRRRERLVATGAEERPPGGAPGRA